MTPTIINLGKRFGLITGDITKARKKAPDVGMDWRAWNAAHPTHLKDSHGRWARTGAMVSELLDVLRRHHGDGPDPVVAKLTEHIERTAHEAGLRSSTRRGDLVRFDPAIHAMSGRKPKAGTMVEVEHPGFDVPEWRLEGLDEADTKKLRMVNVVPARVRRSSSADEIDGGVKAKPRTPKVTAKPERDYDAMAADMRALPVLPESEDAAKRMLEPLNIPELKALAGAADVPINSKMRKQELRDAIYHQLHGHRATTDAIMNNDDPGRFSRRRAMDALHRAEARDGNTMGIEQLRAAMGGTRAEQDAVLTQMSRDRQINLMPQSNQKILTDERRAAALRMGNEDKTLVMLGSQAGPAPAKAPAPKADAKAGHEHVREAFAELKSPTNEWVGLADIREKLEVRGLSREQQDAALMDMLKHDSDVRIIPVANSKALKPRDRQAALILGDDNHLHAMSINPDNARWQPKTPRPSAPKADAKPDMSVSLTGKPRWIKPPDEPLERRRSMADAMRGTKATPRAPKTPIPHDEIAAMIANPQSEDRQRMGEMFSKLTVQQLQEVSAKYGSGNLIGSNKAEKANQLMEHLIGHNLNSRAIRGGKWTDHPDNARHASDADARLRSAEGDLAELRAELERAHGKDPDRWPDARQDRQVEEYYAARDRVARMRRQSAGKA